MKTNNIVNGLIAISFIIIFFIIIQQKNQEQFDNDFYNYADYPDMQDQPYRNTYFNKSDNPIKVKSVEKKHLDHKIKKVINDVDYYNDNHRPCNINQTPINRYFQSSQFNNNYRDVITAFNNIIPQAKQLFNLPNQPVQYSEPDPSKDRDVKYLVRDFMKLLNQNIKNYVPNVRNKNTGWDEAIQDPRIKSGWEVIQESLGLNPSLWDNPATKSTVHLIKIMFIQKYETEDEIKYACKLILQKEGVEEQIMIKASFVQDKTPLNDENNFFVSKNIEMKIVIEEIYILGYLSNRGLDSSIEFDNLGDDFYNYDNLERNNMTDPQYIQKVLLDKYQQRNFEMGQRVAMLDEEGKLFHKELPHVYDYSNIKSTRTIFDDFNYPKTFV